MEKTGLPTSGDGARAAAEHLDFGLAHVGVLMVGLLQPSQKSILGR